MQVIKNYTIYITYIVCFSLQLPPDLFVAVVVAVAVLLHLFATQLNFFFIIFIYILNDVLRALRVVVTFLSIIIIISQ